MTSALANVSNYQIEMDRDVYWVGETVTGLLHLDLKGPQKCRSVKIKLDGSGFVHWHTGSGDDRNDYYGSRKYLSLKETVWGNFYATDVLDGCGQHAHFNVKTFGDGDFSIPFDPSQASTFDVIVRAMDYDWGKKDDLLGEVVVDLVTLANTQPGQPVSFPLKVKGKAVSGKEGPSEVTISVVYEDRSAQIMASEAARSASSTSGMGCLKVRVHQATNLKSADWFGKNDVYVQAYTVPKNSTDPNAALPLPSTAMEMPKGKIVIPFSFTLPASYMPSSFEDGLGDSCYVRYSIYSNIDVSWKLDPSVRKVISVLAAPLPHPTQFAPMIRPSEPDQTMYACCCCIKTGVTNMTAMIDRLAFAPGESIYFNAFTKNGTDQGPDFKVVLRKRVKGSTSFFGGNSTTRTRDYLLLEEPIPPQSMHAHGTPAQPLTAKIPAVAPTFDGNDPAVKGDKFRSFHPVTWSYSVVFTIEFPGTFASSLVWEVPVTIIGMSAPLLQEFNVLPGLQFAAMPQPLVQFVDTSNFAPVYPNGTQMWGACGNNQILLQPEFECARMGVANDPQEDLNQFGGPMMGFTPIYPTALPAPQLYILPEYPQPMDAGGLKRSTSAVAPA
jgi:hypothetical protein